MGCIVQDLMLLAELDAHCERRQSALELPELVQAIIGEYRDQFSSNQTLIYEGSASVTIILSKK